MTATLPWPSEASDVSLAISEKSLVNDVADTDAVPEPEPDDDDVVVDDELLLEQAAASSPPTSIMATRARLLWIPMTAPPNLVSALYTALAGMSRPFRTLQQNELIVNTYCRALNLCVESP